jgi:structural maintenance of chromosome 4
MPPASSRPTRRAATRRNAVVDSDDEEDQIANTTSRAQEDEEDFEPEAVPSPKRQRRSSRQSSVASQPAAPRGRGRPRKSVAPEVSVADEPSIVETEEPTEADITIQADPETPPKRRKIETPSITVATPAGKVMPTPSSTAPSDFTTVTATPLSDITTTSVNTRYLDETQATVKPVRTMNAMMENPIDIRIKSRTMTNMPFVEPEAPKSRIVLTYLILNNFKSYAGRQEVGPFHATFSSVVGPNGSGKSNVIDSLLFVFGFRASKMRQGKISALIHNSAQYPNLEFCEVAVHFHEVMDQVCSLSAHSGRR